MVDLMVDSMVEMMAASLDVKKVVSWVGKMADWLVGRSVVKKVEKWAGS